MAFLNSNLSNLGDPAIWHQLYKEYGWTSNNSDLNGWGTVYHYLGKEVSGDLLSKLSTDTQHIWGAVQIWDSASFDIAERTLIAQSNILRKMWGWYGDASKDYPIPPQSAPYVPPVPPTPVITEPIITLPIKPEVPTILQPATVSDAGYSLEGSPLINDYGEPIEAGFFTPINLLIMSLIGGLGYYVYTKKFAKPSTVSY